MYRRSYNTWNRKKIARRGALGTFSDFFRRCIKRFQRKTIDEFIIWMTEAKTKQKEWNEKQNKRTCQTRFEWLVHISSNCAANCNYRWFETCRLFVAFLNSFSFKLSRFQYIFFSFHFEFILFLLLILFCIVFWKWQFNWRECEVNGWQLAKE